jgi:integrase
MQHKLWFHEKNGSWYVLFGPRLKKRRSLGTDSKKVAQGRLVQWLIDNQHPDQPDLADILDGYEKSRTDHGRSTGEKLRAPNALFHSAKALRASIGDYKPDHLTEESIRKYADDRQATGIADGTIIREMGVLRAALRWAVKNKALTKDQFPDIANPRSIPTGRKRWLTRAEADALLKQCRDPHLKLFVTLGLMTGARHAAILELTWDRVDFDSGLVDFGEGHGNKSRAVVPMNRDLRELLEAAKGLGCSDYVVEYRGRRISTVKNAFEAACIRAGLGPVEGETDVTPHILRHTCATWLVTARISYVEIGKMLGDRADTVENIYGHHHPDFLLGAAKALERDRKAA